MLLDLEQRLQSWEVTLKDCQLPALTQEDVAMVQQLDAALNLPATIREELVLAFENQSTDLEGYQVLLYRCKSETLTRAADDFVF